MKRIALIALLFLLPQWASAACPCLTKSPGEKYGSAHTVFQGLLTDVEEIPGSTRRALLSFRLQESWKGTGNPIQEVIFPISIDACGLPEEEVGRSYLVYARAQNDGTLESTMCDGTDVVDLLGADVRFLNSLYRPDSEYPLVRFSDVPTSHPYASAIREFRETEIVSGFSDGTFRPEWPVSRAEITKILSKTLLPYDHDRLEDTYAFTDTELPFHDLSFKAWYNLYVRRAYRAGVVKGFEDGTFRPDQSVTVAEAIAMIARASKIETSSAGDPWYEPYVAALAERNALPIEIHTLAEPISRGQVVEILWRITRDVRSRDSLSADSLLTTKCIASEDVRIEGVDLRRVRAAWLSLYNQERVKRGLNPYILSAELNRTASLWSKSAATRGVLSHSRDGSSGYYNYNAVKKWFSDLGLSFVNVKSQTFTENIGTGPYRCSGGDCTDDLIVAIRQSFDFYLSEEKREYRPHFNAIVNPSFTMLGMGVVVKNGQYYLTTHFGTTFTNEPRRVCSTSM